ncbi:hypothetical protein TPCV2_03260 [Cutibacterium avidum]|nr:hypothetical protein TPCV4_06930 [Cutibacterium avidum]
MCEDFHHSKDLGPSPNPGLPPTYTLSCEEPGKLRRGTAPATAPPKRLTAASNASETAPPGLRNLTHDTA